MLEREGKVIAKQIKNVKTETLTPEIIKFVNKDAQLYTDEWGGYNLVGTIYEHKTVKHSSGNYVSGRIHTNSIEGFWSLLKRGIIGIYHSTSTKHLQMYVDEFVYRYNTRHHSECSRFNLLLTNTENRLTYKNLING